ncbi:hypothetical protein F2Q70_00021752 [Brassica cretica]|uniref:Uncharacterized protein n=1 Tax=Brassica cretica TaxID=69181 RepID=A0A8S9GXS5_BRACR|nr:hypothetical protein F2Q70_00021752 [Brassica cretica]
MCWSSFLVMSSFIPLMPDIVDGNLESKPQENGGEPVMRCTKNPSHNLIPIRRRSWSQ